MDIDVVLKYVECVFVLSWTFPWTWGDLNNMEYLRKYGYLEPSDGRTGSLLSEEYYKEAVAKFQRTAGLPITGQMDEETRATMRLPRCGVKDTDAGTGNQARRRKRYALHGSKWRKREIAYRISEYSRKMPMSVVQFELQRAFDLWADVIPIRFVRRDYGPVDIEIKFVTGHHGDNTPFDGSGQTLAHAYFPQYGSDAHFDEDENWTVNIADGVNLYQVAAHEFGHSLGLAHSDVRTALMAPFYRGFDLNFKLDRDDIMAAQELYGSKENVDTTTHAHENWSPRETLVHILDICRNASIDAITRTDDGVTYVFKGEYYYRLNHQGIDSGYPRMIEWDWGTVKGPIDAALTWPNGWTFIFKGNQYWKFHNMDMKYGPKNISEGFDGIPSDIDSAFVWSGNGKTYFIKGDKYWRYYGNRIDYGYPRDLKIWRGLPDRIDAAFQWKKGRTYFFSGDQYYRYNDQIFDVDNGGYPRDIATWWLGCPDKSQIQAFDRQKSMQANNNNKNKEPGVTYSHNSESSDADEQWITVDDDVAFQSGLHSDNGVTRYSSAERRYSEARNIAFLVYISHFCTRLFAL
ncbi:matrix metalloproteinase-16-like isoform X2 [Dreissena polymorpha]|uniref:matrix metalloproteinase-16-like isoform X2 n=1 Tax=Dreissena polymorpha TaxID=45954 RepID=UPI002264215D|nr:matrix metalloproteinase-16-like isoform X2 [Dreissena polymorpha]